MRRVCRKAIVGSGEASVRVSFPNQAPAEVRTRLTAFNLGIGSRTLAVLGAIPVPEPTLIAAELRFRKSGLGLRAMMKIPRIGDGAGSLAAFRLNVRRFFFYRGERSSFLSARCPDGRFKVTSPKTVFRNETNASGVPAQTVIEGGLVVPCKGRG